VVDYLFMPKKLLSITDLSTEELRILVNNTVTFNQSKNPQNLLIRPLAKVVAGVVWGLKNAIATLRVSDRSA
jgi:hypothetical protein